MTIPPYRLPALMLALATSTCPAQEIDQDALTEARRTLQGGLDADALGAAYGAMVSVTTAPEMSAATYRIRDNSASQPTMRLYKLPLSWPVGRQDRDWLPYAHASLGLLEYGSRVELVGEDVLARWTAYGGELGLGVRRPAGHWTWVAQGGLGVVRIESRARYQGIVGQTLLAPLLKGLVFDWRAEATKLSVALGADYLRAFDPWRLEARTRLSSARVDTFSSSSEFIDFDVTATVLTVRSDAIRPVTIRVAGRPTRLRLSLGATSHLGKNADALGFDRFIEAGGGLELDISGDSSVVDSITLGALAIYGPDVVGWSLYGRLGF